MLTDLIDVVKDVPLPTAADYLREEDPCVYVSNKTGRGPLNDSWLADYARECRGKTLPLGGPGGKAIMCAYKLCRVEFKYWGMQAKIERFIHDIALRKTMVRAHRQAWTWQDEWYGLTMDDVREIERQTQLALAKKYGNAAAGAASEGEGDSGGDWHEEATSTASTATAVDTSLMTAGSVASSPTTAGGGGVAWPISCIVSEQSSSEDDEFFDCLQPSATSASASVNQGGGGGGGMVRWSSMELVSAEQEMDGEMAETTAVFNFFFFHSKE